MKYKKIITFAVIFASVLFVTSLLYIFEIHVFADGHVKHSEMEDAEAKEIILGAAESSYLGSRFDTIEVSLTGPVLRVYLHDLDACSAGASIQSIETIVDLSIYREKTVTTRSVDYHNEPLTFITFTEWRDHNRELSAKQSVALTQARSEVGWGTEAAILASERFLQKHPLETLSSYRITGYCPSGYSIGFDRDTMTFQITDPQKLLDAFSVISAN